MGKVYRYIDTRDKFIKYVGIVYGENRTLEQRHKEHIKNDIWCDENFKIQYLDVPVNNRSEAESLEAHFISLYKTGGWYNKSKSNWGQNSFVPTFNERDWQNFYYHLTLQDRENIKNKRINLNKNTNDNDLNDKKLNIIVEKLDGLIKISKSSFESINRSIKYGDFTSKKEEIKDLQETLSNKINNIKRKEFIFFPNEFVNKFDKFYEDFTHAKDVRFLLSFFSAFMSFLFFLILASKK